MKGEILRNDVLEVDYGMDHADEYDEIYGDILSSGSIKACCGAFSKFAVG